jgi:hypothetical protein
MEQTTAVMFKLSQEEVFLILAHIKASGMVVINASILDQLSEQDASLALQVAERALIARGYFQTLDNRFLPHQTVAAAINACARPDRSIFVTRTTQQGLEVSYFHIAGDLHVVHVIPVETIHQFFILPDDRSLAEAVCNSVPLTALGPAECPPGEIHRATVEAARKAVAADGYEGALNALAESSLPPETQEAFALSLASPSTIFSLLRIDDLADPDDPPAGGTILDSEQGLWFLQPVSNGRPGKIRLSPISSEQIADYIDTLVGVN